MHRDGALVRVSVEVRREVRRLGREEKGGHTSAERGEGERKERGEEESEEAGGERSGEERGVTSEGKDEVIPYCFKSLQFQLGASMVLPQIDHACRRCEVGNSFALKDRALSLFGRQVCGRIGLKEDEEVHTVITVVQVEYPCETQNKQLDDRINLANEMKEQGNAEFRARRFAASLKRYRQAAQLLCDLECQNSFSRAVLDQTKVSRALSTQAAILLNIAACGDLLVFGVCLTGAAGLVSLGPRHSAGAVQACDRAMAIDGSSAKCFYRRAKVPLPGEEERRI
eukprot:765767-Hanusia_phi.AAC.6